MSTEDFNPDNEVAEETNSDATSTNGFAARPGGSRPVNSAGGNRGGNLGSRGFRPSGGYNSNQNNAEGGDNAEGGAGGGFRPQQRRPRRPGGKDRFSQRRRVCQFCVDKIRVVDYKDFQRLRRYLSDRGKIEPRRKTGTCARHQRSLTTALKRGRYMALLPYVSAHTR